MFQAKKQHGQLRAYQVHPRGSRSHWPEPEGQGAAVCDREGDCPVLRDLHLTPFVLLKTLLLLVLGFFWPHVAS